MLQNLLGALRNEQPITKRVIDAIPVDKGDYRPDAVSMSALDLAWHIASAEQMFLDGILAGSFAGGDGSMPAEIKNSADLGAWYSKMFAEKSEKVAQLPASQLTKMLDFHGVFNMPAMNYLQVAAMHTIHHRGQLTMYLRPMGAKVPAIYGDSYDTRQAKQAAAQ